MIFAKIDYINLIPFYVFIKKNIQSSQIKAIINYKKSYPALINEQFKKRKIDAGFISSIVSQKYKCSNLGIVAKDKVFSVLALEGKYQKDQESASSNVLAKVLQIDGKIIIGDKALQYYYNNPNGDFIDLAQEWQKRYKLPFVFARCCFHKYDYYFIDLAKKFSKTKVKIPQYILKKYSQRSGLTQKQILNYLDKITYDINYKEKKSLKLFWRLSKQL